MKNVVFKHAERENRKGEEKRQEEEEGIASRMRLQVNTDAP